MFTRKRYTSKQMLFWTIWETLFFIALTAFVIFLHDVMEFTFIQVPWTPVALIGTALAFMIGFQNNAAYGRIWEARKIWGGIVNTSRTWGMKIQDMISNEHSEENLSDKELYDLKFAFIRRHIAWMTALRYAMRQERKWEVFKEHRTNRKWSEMIHIPEHISSLEDNLMEQLCDEEKEYVLSKKNHAAALLYVQSRKLRELKDRGLIWEFSFLELENLLEEMFTLQGKSERIKNFPYPRQYATL